MAVDVIDRPYATRSGYDEDRLHHRLSWGGIFAGTVVALGVWLLLAVAGLAFGLTALDPNNPDSLRNAGIGTGIYQLLVPLVSLFIGGFVASRIGNVFHRGDGAIHGTSVWALTSILGFMFVASTLSSVIGGAAKLGGAAVGGAATATAAQGPEVFDRLGLNGDDLVAPINQRLQAQGKPTITADQLMAATRDSLATSVREGRFDRDVFANSLAQNSRLDRADVDDVANQVQQRFNERYGQAKQNVQEGALKAGDVAGKAFLGLFGVLLLGLLASLAGGALGAGERVRHHDRRHGERVRTERVVTDRPIVRESPIVTPTGTPATTTVIDRDRDLHS